MRQVHITHSYPVVPARLWALVTNYDALQQVVAGLITFDGLPDGRARTGQAFDVQVSLFGKLPWQPYHMEVLECDDTAMVLRSSEKGAGVRSWQHHLAVKSDGADGSILNERIDIDAGWLTRPFCWWARTLYRARHAPRLALLTDPGIV